jgi:spore coat protein JC
MFVYEKKLQYPVKIKNTNPRLASLIISQYGGPDGELGASLRYLSQRYSMPYPELKGLLTDIGTEELGHLEMIGAIVHQLTCNLSEQEIKTAGFDAYFVDHTAGIYPTAASGFPWNAASMAVKGDLIADLTEDLAAEQKARVTYDNILRLSDDPDVNDVIKFLRAREIVHFQRFGEAKRTRWRVTKRAAEQNSRKSSKMVACGCLILKSMVMGARPLTASFLRFPQCGHPSSERSCHSVRQSKGRA